MRTVFRPSTEKELQKERTLVEFLASLERSSFHRMSVRFPFSKMISIVDLILVSNCMLKRASLPSKVLSTFGWGKTEREFKKEAVLGEFLVSKRKSKRLRFVEGLQ